MDLSKAFVVEHGLSINDQVGIITGTADPTIFGEEAPLGSLYLRQNGQFYTKIGPSNTDWIVMSQGIGEAVKISATDATAGYLSQKLDVSAFLTKTIVDPGLNEELLLDLANSGVAPGSYRTVVVDTKGRVTSGSNPTTLSGYGITDAQPLDGDLTAISGITNNGYLTRTGLNSWATRTMVGVANQISVIVGTGSSGNTQFGFPSTGLTFPGTEGVRLPSGTSAQRVDTTATIRFNTTTGTLEYYDGATWISLVASTGGTVTSVDISSPLEGVTVTGGPITTAGTFTVALSNDLAAVEALSTTGFAVRSAADSWVTRELVGTVDRIDITNPLGTSGNPTFDISPTYAGQTSITTLGTISVGTWNATTIATNHGGTGRTTIGGANQLLGVNTTVTGLEYKTVQSGGAGLSVGFGSGVITVTNTGVTSISGTANQVIASASTGAVTLSLPQSISTTSTPTFASVSVTSDPTTALQLATKQYVDNISQGVEYRSPVDAATTANITLSGLQTIDGVPVIASDRVLVKDQTNAAENGVYVVAAGAWTRAADLDTFEKHVNAYVFVEDGVDNANTSWICTSASGGTLGTDQITFELFSRAGEILAGTGLIKVGNTISINDTAVTPGSYNNFTVNQQGQITAASTTNYLTGNQNITLQGDVTGAGTTLITTTLSNTGVAAGTYRSVTVDAKGRVSAGTNPTTLAGYGITDAQPLDADLTSLAGLTTTGILVRSATNTIVTRTLIAGSNRISITNANGTAGNITLDVVEANISLNNLSGILATAQGGTGLSSIGSANQILSTNSAGNGLEYRTLTAGAGVTITPAAGTVTIAATNNGTVTSVAIAGSTGISTSGGPITTAGTITLTLNNELQGLSGLSSNGLVTRTAAGTYASRSVVSGAGSITVTNPNGTAGNISLDLTNIGTAGTYRSVTTDNFGRVTSGTNPTTLAGYGITDAINVSEKGVANGVATLDAGGKLPVNQLPATAISETFVVTSQAAQTALTAQVGDVAVRTDENTSYILRQEPASTFSNWQVLLTPTDSVLSVNGQTGVVNVGTVTSVAATQPAAGLTITGSPITNAGTLTFALANDLAAVENLGTTGIAVRTGTSTWATRTLTAGTGISITNANGVSGNPTINATGVTSVGLSAPSIFTVTGSPVTTTGTLSLALNTQAANTFLGGPTTGTAVPTFRTIALDNLSDVTITSPVINEVIAYNGTEWVNTGAVGANAVGLVGVGQSSPANWVLVSGTTYRANFVHNLGTANVVVTVWDTANNRVVVPQRIEILDNNTIQLRVVGNTRTLRVVVVANGQSIVAGGSTPSSVIISKDGVDIATATRVNFTGQAVGVTNSGGGTVTVGVGARFTYFANSLDTPVNSDFAVNSLAPAITDPTYNSLNVRSFSNTVEQGVACTLSIPPGMTNVTFKFRGRPTTAPGAASVVQMRLYHRRLPNNAAVTAWSAAQELANISIPTNANFQYSVQTVTLASLGLVADSLYQFEFTRRVAGVSGTNLGNPFLLAELTVEFS